MSHRKLSSKKCLGKVLKIDSVLKCEIHSRHRKGAYALPSFIRGGEGEYCSNYSVVFLTRK